ncbi:hypothetical protein [Nocardia amikacinitolerans]|uniref:hypothetical protein n=1 Tax=Nocardia amikacinitolerans TaxID=756689 RepID=UPI0020A3A47B|nr:hypothetical protein [Nocardia amikacinitolerans]MCP2276932.1 hypothetical protein [Nocardia amikacinitolerans]
MPDGYDKDRGPYDSNERGRIFESGTDRFYRDRERGYVYQSRIYEAGDEKIRFDKAKDDCGKVSTIEDKSGRIGGKKDEKQLRVLRVLLERGEVHQHLLRSVEGEYISKEARELIDGLSRDFPNQFTHQLISRADAREIWARGLHLERGQQLELPGVREKAREQAARQRQAPAPSLVKQRELPAVSLVRTEEQQRDRSRRSKDVRQRKERDRAAQLREAQERLSRAVADQNRRLAAAREQGKPLAAQELKRSHDSITHQLDTVRAMEAAQARETLEKAGLGAKQIEAMEPILKQGRETPRLDMVRDIDALGSAVQNAAKAQQRREEIERQREQVRDRVDRSPLPREVAQILELGRPQPGETPRPAPGREASQARLHYDVAKERQREQERHRQRGLGREPEGSA